MREKIINHIIMIFIIFLSLSVIFISYLSFFYIQEPVVFHNLPVPIWQEDDNLCVILDYTRYTTSNVLVKRTFKDGILFSAVPTAATGNELGRNIEKICFPVPSTLPEGEYRVITDLEFKINPFTFRTATWESEEIFIDKCNED